MNIDTQQNRSAKAKKQGILDRILKYFIINEDTEAYLNSYDDESKELLADIKKAREDWLNAYENFEYGESSEIVDYYTYTIKAYQVKYEYLLKKAKEKGLRVEPLQTARIFVNNSSV